MVDARRLPIAGPPDHNVPEVDIIKRIVWGNSTRDAASDTDKHRHPNIREGPEHRPCQAPGINVTRLALRAGRDNDGMTADGTADVCVVVIVSIVRRRGVLLVQHQPRGQQLEVRDGADPRYVVVSAAKWGWFTAGGHSAARAITTWKEEALEAERVMEEDALQETAWPSRVGARGRRRLLSLVGRLPACLAGWLTTGAAASRPLSLSICQ